MSLSACLACIFVVFGCSDEGSEFDLSASSIIAFGQTRSIPEFSKLEVGFSEVSPTDSDRFYNLEFLKNRPIAESRSFRYNSKILPLLHTLINE